MSELGFGQEKEISVLCGCDIFLICPPLCSFMTVLFVCLVCQDGGTELMTSWCRWCVLFGSHCSGSTHSFESWALLV
jgi:hypothetical protein